MRNLLIASLPQSYAQQLRSQDIVSSDTIHKLFPALSNLADYQRKFLITIEATFELQWEEQNWGKCFSDHVRGFDFLRRVILTRLQERSFSVYDTYCANCQNAVSTAISEELALSVGLLVDHRSLLTCSFAGTCPCHKSKGAASLPN